MQTLLESDRLRADVTCQNSRQDELSYRLMCDRL